MKIFHRPKRKPDVVIGPEDNPYMERWHLIPRNRWFNIYLHKISRSDDDRALHDHVADNLSIILKGGYIEHLAIKNTGPGWRLFPWVVGETDVHIRKPGNVVFRKASQPHRLELYQSDIPEPDANGGWKESEHEDAVWTLWIKGPEYRRWGFWPGGVWMHWQEYLEKYGKADQVSSYKPHVTEH